MKCSVYEILKVRDLNLTETDNRMHAYFTFLLIFV